MSGVNPTDDLPSVESEQCDYCREPWAWEAEGVPNGPRNVRMCEGHASRWHAGERDLRAELEETAGRKGEDPARLSALFGLARAGFVDGVSGGLPKRSA